MVVVFHTVKVHDDVVVMIVAPVQREAHEIVLRVVLHIRLHSVRVLLSLGDGRVHVLVCVSALLAGEFLVGAEGQHGYDLILVSVAVLSNRWPC